ncbi:MAG: phosphate signaling complex protein PhoU [Planctomycetota bacterium]|nr:phosphate signaling complex protein PhoU [Planctomycetota bacterium]MDA1105484.1 phosphate signaling complex protein PhoU [Planctomycetota bacterium]
MAIDLNQQLLELRREILAMGALVEQRLAASIQSLLHHDEAGATAVVRGDDDIDAYDTKIEASAVKLLALAHPVAGDLRAILASIRICTEFERIGDLVKGVAKRSRKLAHMDAEPPALIVELGMAARTMLSDVIAAYADSDPVLCRRLRNADDRVDDLQKAVLIDLRERFRGTEHELDCAIHWMAIAQRFERIADTAVAAAEDVIFLVEGENVRHAPA